MSDTDSPNASPTVDQARIDAFAEITEDRQFIHIDPVAAAHTPFGGTIAHGFLTLSLIPMLNHQISHINNVRNGINYGCNKVRFTSPVPAGSRNFGFISQFVEIPDDVVFTVEYSVRAAQMAVYQLLGITRAVPPVSQHAQTLHAQFDALVKSFQ